MSKHKRTMMRAFGGVVSLLAAGWVLLICRDAQWAWEDEQRSKRCPAALTASPARQGELPFPHILRVCRGPGLEPLDRPSSVRDACFDLAWTHACGGAAALEAYARQHPELPEVASIDLPCCQRAYEVCSAVFPPGLVR